MRVAAEVSFPVGARTPASVTRAWERAVQPGECAIETGTSSDRTRGARLTVTPQPAAGRRSEPGRSIPPPFPGRGAELRPVAVSH